MFSLHGRHLIVTKTKQMKRFLIIIAIAAFIPAVASSQKSIDNLFSRYGGMPGYVTVSISGNIIKMASALDENDPDLQKLGKLVTGIRILAREDECTDNEDFFDKVYPELQRSGYEEFMHITSSDSKVVFLAKPNGKKLSEMILLVGGEDSAIIQIEGSFTLDDAREISKGVGKSSGIDSLNGRSNNR